MFSWFHGFRGVDSFINFTVSMVSWFYGFMESWVSWFDRFRGANGVTVS